MEIDTLVQNVIKSAYCVHAELGHGFAEKVYENSMAISLRENEFEAIKQHPLFVRFHGEIVGEFFADLYVSGKLIVELKALKAIDSTHKAQVINYLKASGRQTGLLINFGAPKLQLNRLFLNG